MEIARLHIQSQLSVCESMEEVLQTVVGNALEKSSKSCCK
jgi:hypothetical protein